MSKKNTDRVYTQEEIQELDRLKREELRDEYPRSTKTTGRSGQDWDMCDGDYL